MQVFEKVVKTMNALKRAILALMLLPLLFALPVYAWPGTQHVVSPDECSSILEKNTPFQHEGTREDKRLFGRTLGSPVSEEQARRTGGGNHSPLVPMSTDEFVRYVQEEATRLHAGSVQYARYGGKEAAVVVATIVWTKSGLGQPGQVTRTENAFLAQIFKHGKPCWVWSVEPK